MYIQLALINLFSFNESIDVQYEQYTYSLYIFIDICMRLMCTYIHSDCTLLLLIHVHTSCANC